MSLEVGGGRGSSGRATRPAAAQIACTPSGAMSRGGDKCGPPHPRLGQLAPAGQRQPTGALCTACGASLACLRAVHAFSTLCALLAGCLNHAADPHLCLRHQPPVGPVRRPPVSLRGQLHAGPASRCHCRPADLIWPLCVCTNCACGALPLPLLLPVPLLQSAATKRGRRCMPASSRIRRKPRAAA